MFLIPGLICFIQLVINVLAQDLPVKPVYNIGVLFPNATSVIDIDSSLADMIVTSELAIQLAADSIIRNNILPDVTINFTRYYSDMQSPGKTAWATVDMVEDGVNAVIGDMISSMTAESAAITSIKQIPQCSCASASYDLSDNQIYPYFFRTVGNSVLYAESLVNWVGSMGWSNFALIYTNDEVGQQVLNTVSDQTKKYKSINMANIPLYSMSDENIEGALQNLVDSGTRIVVLADSTTTDQIAILKKALQMGLLTEGWAWIVTNDLSPVLQEKTTPEDIGLYDGLMFISGLWNLTGDPAYDSLDHIWQLQRVPEEYSDALGWNRTGLSYNAPQAYACAELLVLGFSRTLDLYPGGRSNALSDLSLGTFNSSSMTPDLYNLNYSGPAGLMEFSAEGDLKSGYFQIMFMKSGQSIPYATIKLDEFELMPGIDITYLGQVTNKPLDTVPRTVINPTFDEIKGIVVVTISALGIVCCIVMMALIYLFRDHQPMMASSPFFCYLQLCGICMAYMTALLFVDKPNTAKCIIREFLITIGFSLVVGSIIAKNYRIYRIFQNVFTIQASKLKSCFLFRIILFIGAVSLIPLIVWFGIYPITVKDEDVSSSQYCWVCSFPTASPDAQWMNLNAAELVVLIWGAILIVISAFLAFKTRRVDCKWSETRHISYVSYNIGIAAVVVSPSFFLSVQNFEIAIYLKIAGILFATTFTLIVLYLAKFIYVVNYIIKNNPKFSLYKVRSESEAELADYTGAIDENLDMNHVIKNMLDFTVQAHQGILPVKKWAKFDFLSIWELKNITLVPLRHTFFLSDKNDHRATQYIYEKCEAISSTENHYMFRVITLDGLSFLFQVNDQSSLDRWIQWFNGDRAVTTEKKVKKIPLATFGANYTPDDPSVSDLSYSNLSHYINDINSQYEPEPTTAVNSFGVAEVPWRHS
ncbi:periplasmic binding protein-like I [Backusella circina FSU 941]|nr:periplasmic binding protein-like I [Backusella circina FSU 941]